MLYTLKYEDKEIDVTYRFRCDGTIDNFLQNVKYFMAASGFAIDPVHDELELTNNSPAVGTG